MGTIFHAAADWNLKKKSTQKKQSKEFSGNQLLNLWLQNFCFSSPELHKLQKLLFEYFFAWQFQAIRKMGFGTILAEAVITLVIYLTH